MEIRGSTLLGDNLDAQLGVDGRPTVGDFWDRVWPTIELIVRVQWDGWLLPAAGAEDSFIRVGATGPIGGMFPPSTFYVEERGDLFLVHACDFDWAFEWESPGDLF